jgi:hypothetical protein
MKKIYSFLAVVFLASMMSSCSSTDSSTGGTNNNNNGGGNNAAQGTMVVTVNGTTHTWTAAGAKSSNYYVITGVDNTSGESVTVSIQTDAPGTFSTSSLNSCSLAYGTGTSTTYIAASIFGSGSIVVSEISPNFKATFSGTLANQSGGSGTATLSNGALNVVID